MSFGGPGLGKWAQQKAAGGGMGGAPPGAPPPRPGGPPGVGAPVMQAPDPDPTGAIVCPACGQKMMLHAAPAPQHPQGPAPGGPRPGGPPGGPPQGNGAPPPRFGK
jgi:hypothetical protein